MCRAYESSYANPKFRSGCDFVAFIKSELAEIAVADLKEGRIGARLHRCHLPWQSYATNSEVW